MTLHPENIPVALSYMGRGMLEILLTMGGIILAVLVLSYLCREK